MFDVHEHGLLQAAYVRLFEQMGAVLSVCDQSHNN